MSTNDPGDGRDDPPHDEPSRNPDDPLGRRDFPAAAGTVHFVFSTSSDGDRWEIPPVAPSPSTTPDTASDGDDGGAADVP